MSEPNVLVQRLQSPRTSTSKRSDGYSVPDELPEHLAEAARASRDIALRLQAMAERSEGDESTIVEESASATPARSTEGRSRPWAG